MLCLFIICIGISTVFTILEFFYLDKSYSGVRRLRISYILKGLWLITAIILAIGFGVSNRKNKDVVAAVFEWFLSFFYGIYLLILSFDLYPAFHTKRARDLEEQLDHTISRITGWWLSKKPEDSAISKPLETDNPLQFPEMATVPNTLSAQQQQQQQKQWMASVTKPDLVAIPSSEKSPIGDMVYQNRRNIYYKEFQSPNSPLTPFSQEFSSHFSNSKVDSSNSSTPTTANTAFNIPEFKPSAMLDEKNIP